MAETFAVETRGIGKPDYTREVSTGKVRAGLRLAYGETLKIFLLAFTNLASPFPYVFGPLGAGNSQAYIDAETGLAMPFTIPQGYVLEITALVAKPNQDISVSIFFDGIMAGWLLQLTGGTSHYDNEAVPLTTGWLDPTGASHTIEFRLTNEGGADLHGGSTVACLLIPVGTNPLPSTKVVRCKFCNSEHNVSQKVTHLTCPKCGELNIYYSLPGFKEAK